MRRKNRNPLQEYLDEQRMPQRALANRVRLSEAQISRFLNGKGGLSLRAVRRVAAVTGIGVLDLLDAVERNLNA